ncbi:MAG: hypothetical protein GX357_03635 [Firmicutes bacterium]|nr:hypothetical protein [Bacillota bacterium]
MTDLPWHREEIFHDEIDNYPLADFFPLQAKPAKTVEEPQPKQDKREK